ncbi:unnamed protein product [Peniophora sp. CBMAI 1063]|nr:unnamed protein product [Peniophora sp. CBMAI 1063]
MFGTSSQQISISGAGRYRTLPNSRWDDATNAACLGTHRLTLAPIIRQPMLTHPTGDKAELIAALEGLFAKYFNEKDESAKEKTLEDKFWGTYLRSMKEEDDALPKDWDGDTGSILTFTGLFAATVAAFLIESYKTLSRDSGDQTVVLLTQLLAATRNASSNPVNPTPSAFSASPSNVIVNALWFCSLAIALACALLATLVQQWSRDYVRSINRRDLDGDIAGRALNHVYIRMGVERYGLGGVVNLIVALVHLAVIIFAAGLLIFLFPINDIVSWCTLVALAVFGLAYVVASVMPIFDASCPYRTPLTYPLDLIWLLGQFTSKVSVRSAKRLYLKWIRRWIRKILHKLGAKAAGPRDTMSTITPHYSAQFQTWIPWDHIPGTRVSQSIDQVHSLEAPLRSRALSISFIVTSIQRIRSSFSGIIMQIWEKGEDLRDLWPSRMSVARRRREYRRYEVLSSLGRFTFLWKRTGRHMLWGEPDSLDALLASLLHILGSMREASDRLALIEYLQDSSLVVLRLESLILRDFPKVDNGRRIAALKLICALAQTFYTSGHDLQSFSSSSAEWRFTDCILVMFATPVIPFDTSKPDRDVTQMHGPAAFLVMFHLRWFLMTEAHRSLRGLAEGPVNLDLMKFNPLYFPDDHKLSQHRRWDLLTSDVRLLKHPRASLLLLNTRTWDPVQDVGLSHFLEGEEDAESCLLPLHDGECCRSRDGRLEHVAACMILTMLAYLLRVPDEDRDKLMQEHLRDYSKLWDHGLSFTRWDHTFEMSAQDRRYEPSKAFLSVLREAGLEEWLRPGRGTAFLPPTNTPLGQFLITPVEGARQSWETPATTIADMLRVLMEHVDMSAVHSGLPESFQWLLSDASVPDDLANEGGDQLHPTNKHDEITVPCDAQGDPQATLCGPVHPLRHRGSGLCLEEVVVHSASGVAME